MKKSKASVIPDDLVATRWTLINRIKDWEDQASWHEFFETYWRLIYSAAIKAGLTAAEAEDVVQETILTVAKRIPEFKADSNRGSFKGWLLHTTRWKIADQYRKRPPSSPAAHQPKEDTARTATEDRIPDPGACVLDSTWDEEWEQNLRRAALEAVKRKVRPEQFQVFDLCVLRSCPPKLVAQKLGLKLWKVYFAQKRVSSLLQRESEKLRKAID